jgi:pantoate--beta-alanine ligase
MKVIRTIPEIREQVTALRRNGSVGLVTTMGALHRGHMALVEAAVAGHESVVATIFVNPTQFGNPSDLETYPKTEDADLALLRDAGVSAVFMPSATEMYPEGDETIVETTDLANRLHGKVRPGHFRGVATVVAKLFNIIGADAAYFGQKDYQQLAVIRRMVRDLHFRLEIIGVETVRDSDGLALSSRNVRLSDAERSAAPILNRALVQAEAIIGAGGTVEEAVASIRAVIGTEALADLQAVDVVDALTFRPITGKPDTKIGVMISALFGEVLLIDQREITP